ncbi:metallophosphoesterase family protein [Spiractinospora alimapuensis]|uniref:metallophosphoesterase family protein n=1 Tax=Spiractinospora alimapuensis TaxID=2820884 RepID=UPI001F190054|nr:metallophosphoesterase family protein [Spiractinospora alimapuensis]QVQ52834.1 metallophosphoesterase family protein [Spiractinospora alimapuensis]
MMERVAVLSDVHAVAPALEAVLNEPDVVAADRVVFTGDLLPGPLPRRTLDLVAELGDRAVWLRGNGERDTLRLRGPEPPQAKTPLIQWCADQVTEADLAVLAALPPVVTLEVTGLGAVLFCHATPRDDEELVLVDSDDDRWREVLAGVAPAESVVVCGHTHMPFLRLVDGRVVLNPGSVGMPFGPSGAHWALLGPGVQLRRTLVDAHAAQGAVERGSDFPGIGAWIEPYLTGGISDAGAKRRMRSRQDDRARGC